MYKKQPQYKPHYYLKLIAKKNLESQQKNCFYLTRCEPGTCGSKCCLYPEEIIYLLSAWKKKIWLLVAIVYHTLMFIIKYYTNVFVWLDILHLIYHMIKNLTHKFFIQLAEKRLNIHTSILTKWSIKPHSRKKVQETSLTTNFKRPIYVQSNWIKISLLLRFIHPNQTAMKVQTHVKKPARVSDITLFPCNHKHFTTIISKCLKRKDDI